MNPEINEATEEDFDLYANELGEAEKVYIEESEDTGTLPEENVEEFIEDIFSNLTKTINSLYLQAESAPNDSSYTPTIADFNHPFNRALRWGYTQDQSIQSIRLGHQLLARASYETCLNDSLFEEFWLDDDTVKTSPALSHIRHFLDQHENDYEPIPEPMLVQARMENPNATIETYREFVPYGGHINSKTPDSLNTALRCVDTIPKAIKQITQVLETAIETVENAYARMIPSQTQTGDIIASSESHSHSLTGIAALNPSIHPTKSKTSSGSVLTAS